MMFRRAILSFVSLILLNGAAQGSGFGSADVVLENVRVPLYGAQGGAPLGNFNAARIVQGQQKRGFFRIGVLPSVRVQKAMLGFRTTDPQSIREGCRGFLSSFGASKIPLEIDDFTVRVDGKKALWARKAHFTGDTVTLIDVVRGGAVESNDAEAKIELSLEGFVSLVAVETGARR